MKTSIKLFSKKDKTDPSQKQKNSEDSVRLFPQVIVAFSCALLMGIEGLMTSFAAATLPHLSKEFDIDPLDPWLPFTYFIAMAVFAPIGGFISKKIGRRRALMCATFPISGAMAYMAVANNFTAILIGRAVSAFGFGLTMPSCGVFIAETCHPRYRGPLLSIVTIMAALGSVYIFSFVHFISKDWRILIWTVFWIPLLSLAILLRLHESPYWLVEKGYTREAKASMEFYRGADISEELNSIIALDEKRRLEKASIAKSTQYVRTFKDFIYVYKKIGVLLLIYQWTGNSSLLSFLSSIFQIMFPDIDNGMSSVIMSVTALISTTLSLVAMRYCRYRILFFVCTLFCMGSSILLATSEYLPSSSPISSYVPIFGIAGIMFFSNFGVYPVLYATNTEIYPINIKSQGVAASQSLSFISISVNAIVFPALNKALTIYKAFWVYAVCSLLLCIYAYFVLPNNKGKNLSESTQGRKRSKNSTEKMMALP